jgi:hypothetical protein
MTIRPDRNCAGAGYLAAVVAIEAVSTRGWRIHLEKTIRRRRLPDSDSVKELAGFWDHHDLTDFEHDLEEVREPVFVRAKGASVSIEHNLPRLSNSRKSRAPGASGKPPF